MTGEAETYTLNSLAAEINDLANTVTKSLADDKVAPCSFSIDSPATYASSSPELFMQRQRLIEKLTDMIYLTQGPNESIFNYCHSVMPDAACLNVLNYFDFWDAVPLDGSASYAEIAKHVNLPEEVVTRILKHAVTLRIFAETEPGKSSTRIKHSFRSAPLARSKGLQALVAVTVDVSGGPLMVLQEALQRYSRGKNALPSTTSETSFAVFHRGQWANSWDMLEGEGEGENKGWRQRQFTTFMGYLKEIFQLEGVVTKSFDWASLGKASVVDIGGSAGHDAFALARKFPDLTITVQDLAQVAPVFEKEVPAELRSQVSFQVHDMFQPQPVQADVYLVKLILHDWPDDEAVKMLRALVPGLKPGARIIFVEYVGAGEDADESNLPRNVRGMGSATDLRIMALFNTKERPASAWESIFKKADERFDVVNVDAKTVGFYAVIEVVWRG